MVKSELLELWTEKERKEGRRISVQEVSEKTGVDRRAITGLLRGETTQFNADVLARICQYFEVEEGPVPFLRVHYLEIA
jgi:transcriptional regulator with XRE-family HTH domain